MRPHFLVSSLLLIVFLFLTTSLAAQQAGAQQPQPQQPQTQGPAPAPATPEQMQALQTIQQTANAQQRVTLVEQFLEKWPKTAYTLDLYRLASHTYRQLNNYAKTIEYAEKAIALNPQDAPSLMLAADALAEGTMRTQPDINDKLARAEQYARKAIEILPQYFAAVPQPLGMTAEEYDAQKKLIEAQPHASLGYIHLLRNEDALAEAELVKAVELGHSQPNPIDLLRLGRAYMFQQKYEQAVDVFRKAVALGGAFYETARQHLQVAEEALGPKATTPAPENKPPAPESKPPAPKPPQP